jgi:hypothetical protein
MIFKRDKFKKLNGCFYILASRQSILKSIDSFFNNYKYSREYPLFVFYFDDPYKDDFKNNLTKKYTNISFCELEYKVPTHVKESKLFYNQKYIPYAQNSFSKKRMGFLHMCNFFFNIIDNPIINGFDFALRWDDDGLFNKKIKDDYFSVLKKSELSALTGKLNIQSQVHHFETRVFLFDTYIAYLKKYNIIPKCDLLKNVLKNIENNETRFIGEYLFHQIQHMTDFNIYNLNIFKNKNWENWSNHINQSGGIYKYRWGENELITLFIRTHYSNAIEDLNLWTLYYDPKGADSNYAPNINLDVDVNLE